MFAALRAGKRRALSTLPLKIFVCLVSVLPIARWAIAQKLVTPGYLFNSDPTCREIDGRFYLFTTQDPFTTRLETENKFYKGMYAFHALSTTDFDNWTDHGSILTSREIRWNTGFALWDGDAGIPANGKYFAYAPFRMNSSQEANYGIFDVGVFVADRVGGPYRDVLGGPMKNVDGSPLEALSPTVINGDDGSRYLIWGSGDTAKHEAMLARLEPDMIHLAEKPRQLAVQQKDACGNLEYFESPMLFKHGSKWYLTYVAYKDKDGPSCDRKGSYVEYAVSDSMFGPFDAPARHLVYPSAGGEESVQQGVCQYRGKWYLAYHLPYDNVAPYNDHHRQVAVTQLEFNADGSLRAVNPDRDPGVGTPGVTSLSLDAFASRRESAEFHLRTKAEATPALAGEYAMKMKDGGYLQFEKMDFGEGGAAEFHVEVKPDVVKTQDSSLEVRLDNPAGQVITTVSIGGGSGGADYRVLSGKVAENVRGVHNLCLVARGEDAPADGYLFSVTWFNFTKHLQ